MNGTASTGALFALAALLAGSAAWPWLTTDAPLVIAAAPGAAAPVPLPAADPQALAAVLERPLFAQGRRPAVAAGGRRRAILRREGTAASLHLAEGDTVDGWVVRAISPDRVVLVSPDGELVLPAR
jgi:hypothetical protein